MKRVLRGRLTTVAALVALAVPSICGPAAAAAADRSAAQTRHAIAWTDHRVHRIGTTARIPQTSEVSCAANTKCRDSSWGG